MPQVQSLPQLASLPIDEPIGLPKASPGEFASPGATVHELGQETANLALANQAFEGHLINAQRQLTYKQIEIDVGRLEEQAHNDLSKAVTPEDAQAIYTNFNKDVDNLLSPHMGDNVFARELNLFGQQVDVQMQNTVNGRKATIIQHGDNAANDALFDSSTREAINTRAAGGDYLAIRKQMEMKLDASVHAMGTMLPQTKDAILTKWDKDVEAGYIDAQLNSPNLQTVQNTVNDLRTHPENYPTLNSGQINALAEKGQHNVASMMSLQDEITAKAERDQHWNQTQTGIPKMFTDINGNFDSTAAMKYVGTLGLSPDGERLLANDIKTHSIVTDDQKETDFAHLQNAITQASSKHDWKKVDPLLDQMKLFADAHPEYANAYKTSVAFENSNKAQQRAEINMGRSYASTERADAREQAKFDSNETLALINLGIHNGQEYSDDQLRSMVGTGKGKMLPSDVQQAINISHALETDPENKPYYKSILQASPTAAIAGNLQKTFTSWLRKNPNASADQKAAQAEALTQPDKVDEINDKIDQINGVKPFGSGVKEWWRNATTPPTHGSMTTPSAASDVKMLPQRPMGVPDAAVWNPQTKTWQLPKQ